MNRFDQVLEAANEALKRQREKASHRPPQIEFMHAEEYIRRAHSAIKMGFEPKAPCIREVDALKAVLAYHKEWNPGHYELMMATASRIGLPLEV